MRRDEEMSDFGLKSFMNKLWSEGVGKTVTGHDFNGEWFEGVITEVRAKFGTDIGVKVQLADGDFKLLSGLEIAKGTRFMSVEGL